MSEYIVKLPTYGAADEFFKTHEMPDMTLYGYPLTGEIIRCRDCKYRYGCLHLVDDGDDDMRRCHASPDNFCAWGEPRGKGEH